MNNILIKELLKEKDNKKIFSTINNYHKKSKGHFFEYFLFELFKGNGWHVVLTAQKGDLGADILLYKSAMEKSPSFIIQAKNFSRPLTYDQVKIELVKFEEKSSLKYKCKNYLIYSMNGYSKTSKSLSRHGISLNDFKDIEKLIGTYSTRKKKQPSLMLSPYNSLVYDEIKKFAKKKQSFAVIQATGTGKSYLIASQLNDLPRNKKAVVIAPTNIILKKQNQKAKWLKNVEYKTYSQILEEEQSGRLSDDYKLIILDELHRAGAKEWKRSIDALIKINNAIVSGYSATPIRYLDGLRDMSLEFFGENIIYGPDISKGIITGVLRKPKYVSSIYHTEALLRKHKKCNSKILSDALSSWVGHNAIEKVLNDHPVFNGQKYIVFCENEKKLNEIKYQLEFAINKLKTKNDSSVDIESYIVTHKNSKADNLNKIEKFENFNENKLKLLFSINMLNEGVHVDNINGVFLFRKTSSPNIFLQQIGRALSISASCTPIIYDFVQNGENLNSYNFKDDFNKKLRKINIERKKDNLKEINYINDIFSLNYTKDFFELIEEIRDNSNSWNKNFKLLNEYYLKNGHTNIPQRSSSLGKFVSRIREDFKNNSLSEDRILNLKKINFDFNFLDNKWLSLFQYCLSNSDSNGLLPENHFDEKSKRFYDSMRRMYRRDSINDNKRYLLDKHGFIWNAYDYAWGNNFLQASILKQEGNDIGGFCKKHSKVGKWMYKHRKEISKLNINL